VENRGPAALLRDPVVGLSERRNTVSMWRTEAQLLC
jgi:hypothetical protein